MTYLGALRRRATLITGVTVVGSALALGIAYILPAVYQSNATILVESQQIPSDLARSTVVAGAAERLKLIEQRLMTRQNLLDVIERLELYQDRPDLTPTQKIDLVRASTRIEPISLDDRPQQQRARTPVSISAFRISYETNNPQQSARVANEFVTMVLEQNIRARSERASDTLDFFRQEVERLSRELAAVESEITAFKNTNEVALPDSLEYRRRELSELVTQDYEREQRRITLEEQRKTLELVLAQGLAAVDPQSLTPEERELQQLQSALTQKRAIFADTHPEVRALLARVRALEATVAPSVAAAAAAGETEGAGRQQVETRRQIELIDTQLALIARQSEEGQARRQALQASIEATPEVEMALNALARRQTDLQTQYQVAVAKQAEAETGEKLEVNRQAERFEVIEQATVPEAPISPNRPLIAAGGVAGSLGLGLGLAILLEMLNTSIRTAGDLQRRLDLRAVATIPYIETGAERRRRRWLFAAKLVVLLIVIPAALWAVDRYYLPLGVLADRMLERSGLDTLMRLIDNRFG